MRSPDHPRVLGEHLFTLSGNATVVGSPPGARGALHFSVQAHVGKGDHPRVRGEHLARELRAEMSPGSPPRARGAHYLSISPGQALRITPACAGSTSTSTRQRRYHRDHPRVRGEHGFVEMLT